MSSRSTAIWVVVPAAGVGSRFGGEIPKQYLKIHNRTVVEHTLEALFQVQPEAVIVALNPEDQNWQSLDIFDHPLVNVVEGGAERANSVLAGLEFLASRAGKNDWVLVHDVARPCVLWQDIEQLIATLESDRVGGLLASPVSDTLKRVLDDRRVDHSEDRTQFWSALTPQMFRFQLLLDALRAQVDSGVAPTDEAGAIEAFGEHPLVVEGQRDNIKITRPEDLVLAEAIIGYQTAMGVRG